MEDLDVIEIFMTGTLQAVVHLRNDETVIQCNSNFLCLHRVRCLVCGFVCVAVAIPATVFLCALLSRFRRLSFSCAGVVLAALALEKISDQGWFPNAEKGFVDPGERTSRESLGEGGLDWWKKGVDV